MSTSRIALALGALVSLTSSPASAFEGAESFGNPVIDPDETLNGGGGQRWFTGSPLDGHTCGVCHEGGEEAFEADLGQVELRGLPPEGWVPGQTYTLVLELPETTNRSGAIEITDRDGAAVGTLSVLAAPAAEDLCEPDPDDPDPPAPVTIVTAGGRQIAMGNQCRADQLSVIWTTPPEAVTAVLLSAVAVAADGLGSPEDDATVVIQRQLAVAGDIEEGPRVGSVCGVSARGQAPGGAPLAVLTLAGVLIARRRSR